MKKILSVVLVISMIMAVALPCFATVTYPEGVTEENATKSATNLDTLIKTMLKETENKTLADVVYPMLYSDETLNQVFTSIYSQMEENASSLSSLGIDLSTANVAACLSEYPSVSSAVASASSLSAVNLDNAKWGVKSKNGFCMAVADMLEPFNNLFYMLFCSGSIRISILPISGGEGYKNGIVPILEAMGCPEIMDVASFDANAAARKNTMIENLVMMVLKLLDEILESPATKLCEKLPNFAYFLTSDQFSNAIDGLLKPLSIRIGDIVTLVPATKVLSIFMTAQDSEKYTTDFVSNMTTMTNEMLESSDVKMAEIKLNEVAACGTLNGDKVTANIGEAFVEIMTWLLDTVKLNKDKLPEMMKDSDIDISQYQSVIDSMLAKESGELLAIIVKFLTSEGGTDNDYQWAQLAFTPTAPTYTPNLGETEYQKVVDGIDELIGEFLAEGGEYKNLKAAVKNNIYCDKTLSQLVTGLYSAVATEEMSEAFSMLGLDVSPKGVASMLTEDSFSSVKSTLSKAESWDKIKAENLKWGIKTGSSKDFENALVAVLRPFAPALRMLLASDTIALFGALKIGGSNGYNTAIIPILEALGCNSDDILTYDEYKAQADGDGCIKAVVDPIIKLINKASNKPIDTVLGIAPNLLTFISSGNLVQALMNLLYPVQSLLDEFGITFADLGVDIDEIKNMDVLDTISKKVPEMITDLKVTEPNLKALATLGTAETRTSKATYQGANYSYTYVVANKSGEMVTVLRFIVGLLQMEENADVINNLMASGNDDAGMFSQYSSGIGDTLGEMTTDECIEWLYKLFFHERVVEETTVNDYHPTIKYEKQEKSKINYTALIVIVFMLILGVVFIFANRSRIAFEFRRSKENRKAKKEQKNQGV